MLQATQHGHAQLMQRGEGQFHLGLHTRGACYPAARRIRGQVVKQRGLAYTRFARHHQCLTLTGANCGHEPVERVALGVAVNRTVKSAAICAGSGDNCTPGMALLRKESD